MHTRSYSFLALLVLLAISSNARSQTLIDTQDSAYLTDAYNAQNLSLGNVTTWTDLIGGNNATVASAKTAGSGHTIDAVDPTVADSNSAFLGAKYVNFGSDTGLSTASALFSGSSARTVAVVYDTPVGNNSETNGIVGEAGPESTGSWFQLQARSSPAGSPYLAGYVADDPGNGAAPTANQLTFAIAIYTGTQEELFWAYGTSGTINSLTETEALNTVASPFTMGFGVNGGSANDYSYGDMQLGQVLVYNNAMTATQAEDEIADLQEYYANGAPEPSTYVLLLAGLGCLGFLFRRKNARFSLLS